MLTRQGVRQFHTCLCDLHALQRCCFRLSQVLCYICTLSGEGVGLISYTFTNTSGCSATATTNITVTGYNALNFDGTDDRVTLPRLHTVGSGSGQFTVEGWIKIPSYTGSDGMIFGDERNANGGINMSMNGTGHIWTFTPGSGTVTSTSVIPLNTWTHIAFVQNANALQF